MIKNACHKRSLLRVVFLGLRHGWPVLLFLGILWFPFDWLSDVWPMFAVPFHQIFRTAHDHFVGHTVFFFIIGMLILRSMPALRFRLHWYVLGLIIAAVVQETIQACFRGEFPTFTDVNAFQGDALGGIGAGILW